MPLSLRPQGKAKVAEVLSADIRLTLPVLSISVTCSLLSLRLFFRLIKSNKSLSLRRKLVVLSTVQISLTDNVPLFTYLTIGKEGFKTFPDVTLMTALDTVKYSYTTLTQSSQ